MSACGDKELMLQALLDGELDASNTLGMEAHLRICSGCAAEFARLVDLRSALRSPGIGFKAPDGLLSRIDAALESGGEAPAMAAPSGVSPPRSAAGTQPTSPPQAVLPYRKRSPKAFLLNTVFGGSLAALAAALFWAALFYWPAQRIAGELVASHVRSLLATHLIDVESSDRHVVKPWFIGRIDFAPPVIELADVGFPLAGGRLDYLEGRVVAAIVYRRRQHVINLFVWPTSATESAGTHLARRDGYSLMRWEQAGLQFWAVSDIDPSELREFRDRFTQRAPP